MIASSSKAPNALKRQSRCLAIVAALRAVLFMAAPAAFAAAFPSAADWRDVPIYMIFTDRFADGDPTNNALTPGAKFAPTAPWGVHGGDFAGIETHLDYIRGLGARAIWITPVFLNGPDSAWHGYGAIDLRTISPQLGGLAGLRRLIGAAHARGIYVFLDVVMNHLGSVLTSDDPGWPHFRADGPGYQLRWVSPTIRPAPPFDRLDWFHNRGRVENWSDPVQSVVGQFASLADLRTELPEVRAALTEAHQQLIRDTDCDGFRVDTVRHVEKEFWPPWCTAIRAYATGLGKTNFLMFGELALPDDRVLAGFTGPEGAPERAFDSLLDFPFNRAVTDVVCRQAPTRRLSERLARLTSAPYSRESRAQLVTFIDNHDGPRFLSRQKAKGDRDRLRQALVALYTMPGIPCLYYGTEQGFEGGNDPYNREDMIARLPDGATTNHFDTNSTLYRFVAELNALRAAHPALRVGATRVLAESADGPGLFACLRQHGNDGVLVILNTATQALALPPLTLPEGFQTRATSLLRPGTTVEVGPAANAAPQIPPLSADILVAPPR